MAHNCTTACNHFGHFVQVPAWMGEELTTWTYTSDTYSPSGLPARRTKRIYGADVQARRDYR